MKSLLKRFALLFVTYERAESIKTVFAGILYYTGIAAIARRFVAQGAIILMYHSVSDGGVFWDNAMTSEEFERQIRYVQRGHEIVPLSRIVERLESGAPIPPTWVAVTFDDGYRDNLTAAAPILRKHGATASIYPSVGVVDRSLSFYYDQIQIIIETTANRTTRVELDGRETRFRLTTLRRRRDAVLRITLMLRNLTPAERHTAVNALAADCGVPVPDCERVYLSPDDLRQLAASGIEIGSHAMTHPNLALIPEEDLAREVGESRRRLGEILGGPVEGFAYPFGKPKHVGERAVAAVRRAGYRYALATQYGRVVPGSDPHCLPRISAGYGALVRLKVRMMGIDI